MVWLTVSRLIVLHPQHHPRPLLLALIWPLIRLLSAIKDLFGLSPSPYWLVKWMHSLGCDSFLYFIVVLHSFFFFSNKQWDTQPRLRSEHRRMWHRRLESTLGKVCTVTAHGYQHWASLRTSLCRLCLRWNDLLLIRFGHCRFKFNIMSRVSSCSYIISDPNIHYLFYVFETETTVNKLTLNIAILIKS